MTGDFGGRKRTGFLIVVLLQQREGNRWGKMEDGTERRKGKRKSLFGTVWPKVSGV